MARHVILNANVLDFGIAVSARDFSGLPPATLVDIEHYTRIARTAERGTLDAFFLADIPAHQMDPRQRGNRALEPTVILAAVAEATERIGIIGTLSTTYNDPVELAERILALDHLSGGRAAWNAVTSFFPAVSDNFGGGPLPDRASRYRRAGEFVDVVLQLWSALETGDAVAHTGEFFRAAGRLPLGPSPQSHPLIVQAGGSPQGRELAGRTANGVFSAEVTLEAGIAHYEAVKRAALAHGRSRDDIAILPGLTTIIGSTTAEAQARLARTRELLPEGFEVVRLSESLGFDFRGIPLDDPVPQEAYADLSDAQSFTASLGFRESVVAELRSRPYTVREALNVFGGGGHRRIVGTPEQVADTIEEWFRAGAADGFNLMPDVLPDGLETFVDHVVPILRSRGLFRHEYAETTLRDRWGVAPQRVALAS